MPLPSAPARPVTPIESRRLLRLGRDLIDAQLWCAGRDILHPDGNALLRRGFVRHRAPLGETGSTAYELTLPGDRRLVLWGFAAFHGPVAHGQGLLLRRHPFAARLAAAASLRLPLWRPEQLPASRPGHDARATGVIWRHVVEAARALAAHERWTLATLGSAHRARCDAERPRAVRRRQTVPCTELANAWTELAAGAERLAQRDA